MLDIATDLVNQVRQFSKFDIQIHCPGSHDLIKSMRTGDVYNSLLQKMTLLQGPENRAD